MFKIKPLAAVCLSAAIVTSGISSSAFFAPSDADGSAHEVTSSYGEVLNTDSIMTSVDNSLTPNTPESKEIVAEVTEKDITGVDSSKNNASSAAVPKVSTTQIPKVTPTPVATPKATPKPVVTPKETPKPVVTPKATPQPTVAPKVTTPTPKPTVAPVAPKSTTTPSKAPVAPKVTSQPVPPVTQPAKPTVKSTPAVVDAATKVTGAITTAKTTQATIGTTTTFAGKLTGQNKSRVAVLERNVNGKWTEVQRKTISVNGNISFTVKFTGAEAGQYRVSVLKMTGWAAYTSPVSQIADARKNLAISLSSVDYSVRTTTSANGVSGNISYSAPKGSNGAVSVVVSRYLSTGKTWQQVSSKSIPATTTKLNIPLSDKNLKLNGVNVTYRVEIKADKNKNAIGYSIDVPISYKLSYPTTVANSTLNGKSFTVDSTSATKFTGTVGKGSGAVRNVIVQRYDTKSKTWTNTAKTTTDKNGKFSVSPWYYETASESFRIHIPATMTDEQYTGPSTKVVIRKPAYSTAYTRVDKAKTTPWDKNTIYTFVSSNPARSTLIKPKVTLQKLNGTKWTDVKSVTGYGNVTIDLPKGTTQSKNEVQSYRISVSTTAMATGTVTGTFKVTWENPNKYTGKALETYKHIKAYCPNATITVKKLPTGIWGYAYVGTNRVEISPDVPAKHLKTVALHECAHHKQGELYIGEWENFKKKMNTIYGQKGTTGMEQNADCIANIWSKNSYWSYGGANCSGNKGTVAKAISQGKRF